MGKKAAIGADLGQAMPSIDAPDPAPPKTPDEYETKGHMSDLIRAHEIINDPVKMKAVHALAGRHNKAIKSIQDIKNFTQAKYGPKNATPGVQNLVDTQPADEED